VNSAKFSYAIRGIRAHSHFVDLIVDVVIDVDVDFDGDRDVDGDVPL
jgi:hypothetical protein